MFHRPFNSSARKVVRSAALPASQVAATGAIGGRGEPGSPRRQARHGGGVGPVSQTRHSATPAQPCLRGPHAVADHGDASRSPGPANPMPRSEAMRQPREAVPRSSPPACSAGSPSDLGRASPPTTACRAAAARPPRQGSGDQQQREVAARHGQRSAARARRDGHGWIPGCGARSDRARCRPPWCWCPRCMSRCISGQARRSR